MSEFDGQFEREIIAGERWLAALEAPRPTRESIEQAKRAVRAELARSGSGPAGPRWAVWQGALASAAAIALCVTVGWYSVSTHRAAPGAVAMDDTALSWPSETEQEIVRLAYLDDALADVDALLGEDAWDLGGASLYDALQQGLSDREGVDPVNTSDDVGASIWRPNQQDAAEGLA